MRIALASDHAGYDLKEAVARFLASRGLDFTDFGSRAGEAVDYVDLAEAAASSVAAGAHDRAILLCGTGMGMSVAANKIPGLRATVCWNAYTAEMSRSHNDSNCLTMGGRVLSVDEALAVTAVWLDTPFGEGRHRRRLDKIRAMEARYCGAVSAKS